MSTEFTANNNNQCIVIIDVFCHDMILFFIMLSILSCHQKSIMCEVDIKSIGGAYANRILCYRGRA